MRATLRELAEREEGLDFALESAELGQWSMNLTDRTAQRNLRHDQIFGYDEPLADWSFERFAEHVVPEDRAQVTAKFEHAVAVSGIWEFSCRIARPDGERRWIWSRARIRYDEDGEIDQMHGIVQDITDRKRAEEEARDARSRLESTLVASDIGTWEFDAVNGLVSADPNLGRMLRLSEADTRGGSIEAYLEHVHPDDVEGVQIAIQTALEAGNTYEAEFRVVNADGTFTWLVGRGRVERNEAGEALRIPGLVVDVTGRREAQERERELLEAAAVANSKFRTLFEQGAVFAGLLSVDGTLIEANRMAWEACGYRLDEVVGKPFWEGPWWSPSEELADQIREATKRVAEGRPFHAQLPYYVSDGSRRFVDINIAPVRDDAGRIVFLAPTGSDITEQKLAEAQLARANEHKDSFLATLAHELRNPLAPLRTGLDLLDHDQPPEVVERVRGMMQRQLTLIVRLVDDLMDVSRISRDKLELRKAPVEFATVIESAVETSRPQIERMRQRLDITLPTSPVMLDADAARLGQVFSNLLNNAAKYSEPSSVITLTARRDGDHVEVRIKDEGIGIEPDKLEGIFEMFSQLESGLERAQGGLGIGLMLVKRLVEMHDGRVFAKSDGPGRGAEFVVCLPILEDPSLPALETTDTDAEGTPRRVLVVDDNRDAADTLAELLRMHGHDVHTSYDGGGALRLADELRPEVIVLDIGLPDLDGFEVCRRLRSRAWSRDPMIIALTGWGQPADREKTTAAGFDHHMVKPIEMRALMNLVRAERATLPVDT